MLKSISCCILLFFAFTAIAQQDLYEKIKIINPALFLKNIENEKVFCQKRNKTGGIIFHKKELSKQSSPLAQTFSYQYIDPKNKNFVLELLSNKKLVSPITVDSGYFFDFEIKIYAFRQMQWQEATLELLPPDFIYKTAIRLPQLQSGNNYYFYNLNPYKSIKIVFKKGGLFFIQKRKTILQLVWKNNKFVWN